MENTVIYMRGGAQLCDASAAPAALGCCAMPPHSRGVDCGRGDVNNNVTSTITRRFRQTRSTHSGAREKETLNTNVVGKGQWPLIIRCVFPAQPKFVKVDPFFFLIP